MFYVSVVSVAGVIFVILATIIFSIWIISKHLQSKKTSNKLSSDSIVHDSQTALTEEEKEKLKEKIINRLKASGMNEETIKEKLKSINEYLDNIKNSPGGYANLTANPNNDSTPIEILSNIPDLSKWYPDYEAGMQNDQFFTNKNYDSLDKLMDEYIETKINDKTALHPKNIRQRANARIIFSIITFLVCSYFCLYHEHFILCAIIEYSAFSIYRRSMRRMNLVNYIKKEIMARPNDNMDYIIESIKPQAIANRKGISSIFPNLTIVLCCLLFLRPHIIYEKNDTGYSVRYYTLAIINDSKVKIPDEYEGEKVNEIRGKTFYNMFMIEEVKLPKYITEIRGNTFENSGVKKIEIPEGVTRIGGHAFYGCRNLSDVTLPDSLKTIGSSAFRRCKSLMHIRIPRHTDVNERAFKESPTNVERYDVNE